MLAAPLFPVLLARLLDLLADLNDADWQRPTACPGWTVRDIVLHMLADELNTLSRLRDSHQWL